MQGSGVCVCVCVDASKQPKKQHKQLHAKKLKSFKPTPLNHQPRTSSSSRISGADSNNRARATRRRSPPERLATRASPGGQLSRQQCGAQRVGGPITQTTRSPSLSPLDTHINTHHYCSRCWLRAQHRSNSQIMQSIRCQDADLCQARHRTLFSAVSYRKESIACSTCRSTSQPLTASSASCTH